MTDTQMTTLDEEIALLGFVKEAVVAFNTRPDLATFSNGRYLAMRWGLMDDCVRVVRVDPEWTVRTYVQALTRLASRAERGKDGGT